MVMTIHDDDTLSKRNNNACFRCMVVLEVVNTVFSLPTIQFAHWWVNLEK